MIIDTVFKQICIFLFPALDLLYATSGVFIKRNLIFFDKLGVLGFYVEHIVFSVMLT